MKIKSEFKSLMSYQDFARKTKKNFRYFFDEDIQDFLDTVLETSKKRHRRARKGCNFYRSQIGNSWRPVSDNGEHVADVHYPYPPERMKPQVDEAQEGRANPKGIPYLYLATDKDTAMAEARPWLGAHISLGQFKINRDIKLVDCSLNDGKRLLYYLGFDELSAEKKEECVWSHIDNAFSSPVSINDSSADYIPTQIIAELFKKNGFDGIFYKSNFGEGHNFVLFDLDIAQMTACFLFKTKKIKFKFDDSHEEYFVRK